MTRTGASTGCWVECVQYEANVDDMDPRIWPAVIERLLDVGAHDAWVTPIVMKKGRPAFTLGVLCDPDTADDVRSTIFRECTTIRVRQTTARKYVLDRTEDAVEVEGRSIGVKTAMDDGQVVNRSVEWDDVVAAATALGLSAKEVLALATAEANRRSP